MQQRRSVPKQHHYVPKSYLARFSDAAGFLHVYDQRSTQFRRQRPKEVMRINAYYRQSWAPEGIDPNVMETTLGEWLEPEGKTSLDRLIAAPETLTDDDTATLFAYLEVQRIRVPRQAESAKVAMRAAILRLAPADVVNEIESGRFLLTIKDGARFEAMRALVGKLGPWFASIQWEIFTAAEGASFITTDSPVAFYHPQLPPPAEAGIGLRGTMVCFPLDSKHALVMRHHQHTGAVGESDLDVLPTPEHEDGHLEIITGAVWERAAVDRFNWKMARLCSSLIVAKSDDVLERCI